MSWFSYRLTVTPFRVFDISEPNVNPLVASFIFTCDKWKNRSVALPIASFPTNPSVIRNFSLGITRLIGSPQKDSLETIQPAPTDGKNPYRFDLENRSDPL